MVEETVEVKIPKKLYDQVSKMIKEEGLDFKSVDDYVIFVLKELLKEEEEAQVYSPEEEKAIKERLRSLGYI